MIDTKNSGEIALNGYQKTQLSAEVHLRKGGTNTGTSQVQTRPADPAPIRRAGASQGAGGTPANSSGDAAKK